GCGGVCAYGESCPSSCNTCYSAQCTAQ
uniref:Conotoxin Bt9.2 n=1 Tax=Conus betulinus TaxID=89764 RepID=CP92_CONBE|nr:RecName: Full=Conotoxin Bt9.2; AltName: Full=Conotoxin BeTXIIb [Conus betulinus]